MTVRRSALDPRRAILQAGKLRLPCAIGRSGTSIFKREGDGASPVATMALVAVRIGPGRGSPPRFALPSRRTLPRDGWCDAPRHPAYNREVRFPFPASAERMRRTDRLYDIVIVLDWNVTSRRRGAGSAIFLHIARPDYAPTQGCVAVSPRDMRVLAPLLTTGARLRILR